MASPLPESWNARLALDRAHVWHPFTQMKEHEADPPIPVVGGEGPDLLLADGRRVLDGISSWWTSVHGHGHPRLVEALSRQAARLDHAMFAGFTHEPALELVARLKPWLPSNLTRGFFSDNGSTAVEVALKMAFQAQLQRGARGRERFGALAHGYHGDTLGAVAVGDRGNFLTGLFAPLLLACDALEVGTDPRREIGGEASETGAALEAERGRIRLWFEAKGPGLAAFIAEPLLQGAGGMRMWPPELLQEIRLQCDRFGVYLILDEVMTGFGRTGTFLALEQAAVLPDLLCLSKGLSGGTLPLAMTWATDEIYGHFWGEYAEMRTFFHGHSFTANPIACAVACASLALFEETPVLAKAQALATTLRSAWSQLAAHPALREVRTLGCVAAARVVDPATGEAHLPEARFPWRFHRRALDHGLLVRPIGDCLYLMPPIATPPGRVESAISDLAGLLD
ncbi:MAG: adenosylmethionine--8-amino-7-oxononanoate transaminase [Holophagaceae bacterium]|nr:adenosylmethionine--8-amino-7-oxononanoate transaminase [Holophagaceae bacterium]